MTVFSRTRGEMRSAFEEEEEEGTRDERSVVGRAIAGCGLRRD
jgi:hypothetical protein